MPKKKTVEDEIAEFLELFGKNNLFHLLNDIAPLLELYSVDDEGDWVKAAVGEEDCRNVRLIRTVYLLSWFCEMHVPRLCSVRAQFKDLWKRIEKEGEKCGQAN